VGQPPSAVLSAKLALIFPKVEESMSTRSSIWYAEKKGKTVHIYWELGEREMKNGRGVSAPV